MSVTDFPRGLDQPAGSFRFSADALLLAAFAPGENARRAADLGTGCGVVAFGLALRFPTLICTGIDKEAALIKAAADNARMLGLEERVSFAQGNVTDKTLFTSLERESYDLVTANPPYRIAGTGRRINSRIRQEALEAPQSELADFIRAARILLRHHGCFAAVFLPARLNDIFVALRSERLEPRRLRCVHPRPGAKAGLILVEACKNAQPDLVIAAPLTLYSSARGETLSSESLAFCPWLGGRLTPGE